MDNWTVASAYERIDDMQIQVAEIRTEVKIQFKEVFARVKRLEAIMIGASASIIAMLVMVLTRMPWSVIKPWYSKNAFSLRKIAVLNKVLH